MPVMAQWSLFWTVVKNAWVDHPVLAVVDAILVVNIGDFQVEAPLASPDRADTSRVRRNIICRTGGQLEAFVVHDEAFDDADLHFQPLCGPSRRNCGAPTKLTSRGSRRK